MELNRLSINTATLGKVPLPEAVNLLARAGVPAIGPWRSDLASMGAVPANRLFRDAGLQVSGLCRGGFFTVDSYGNLDDNYRAVDEALEIGAQCLVVVSGGLLPGSKDLLASHAAIGDGLAHLLEYARPLGMPIAIEPLHPMYAADRCAINTLGHALGLCRQLGPGIGVAIDAYHLWWDPHLQQHIADAGNLGCILAYHVCDWLVPTQHLLLDRGLMGQGVIDLKELTRRVDGAGYMGFVEVEIFSEHLWTKSANQIVGEVKDAFLNHC